MLRVVARLAIDAAFLVLLANVAGTVLFDSPQTRPIVRVVGARFPEEGRCHALSQLGESPQVDRFCAHKAPQSALRTAAMMGMLVTVVAAWKLARGTGSRGPATTALRVATCTLLLLVIWGVCAAGWLDAQARPFRCDVNLSAGHGGSYQCTTPPQTLREWLCDHIFVCVMVVSLASAARCRLSVGRSPPTRVD